MGEKERSPLKKSGVPGIYWQEESKKWYVRVHYQSKPYHMGSFPKLSDAKKFRAEALSRIKNDTFTDWYKSLSISYEDLTGQRFGRLYVVKRHEEKSKDIKWICKCDCGGEHIAYSGSLKSGKTKSCGCLIRLHLKTMPHPERVHGTSLSMIKIKKPTKRSKSGIRGVYWSSVKSKWFAEIFFQGKRYFLGLYTNKEDAAKARSMAEAQTHDRFLSWYEKNHPAPEKKRGD